MLAQTNYRVCPGNCIMYVIRWCRPVIVRQEKYAKTKRFLFWPAKINRIEIFKLYDLYILKLAVKCFRLNFKYFNANFNLYILTNYITNYIYIMELFKIDIAHIIFKTNFDKVMSYKCLPKQLSACIFISSPGTLYSASA